MNFNSYLFRCHSLGDITSNDKSRKGMGLTCMKKLIELQREQKYGISKSIENDYINKGLEVEPEAIRFYSLYKFNDYKKNEKTYSNEFITGTPDIISDEYVIDIKSAWTIQTMPHKLLPYDKSYYAQLQGYMWLTGLRRAILAHVLVGTPESIIEKRKYNLQFRSNHIDVSLDEEYNELCEQLDREADVSYIPTNERIVEYEFEYDEPFVESLINRVNECRIFMNNL